MSVATAKQAVELGTVLDAPVRRWRRRFGQAWFRSGSQARVIGTTVTSLDRDGIDGDTVREAETLLLMHANILGPGALTWAGERILGHVTGDRRSWLKRKLDQAEARARIDRGLNLSLERDLQRTRISGYLTAEGAAIVQAALEPVRDKTPPGCGRCPRRPQRRRPSRGCADGDLSVRPGPARRLRVADVVRQRRRRRPRRCPRRRWRSAGAAAARLTRRAP